MACPQCELKRAKMLVEARLVVGNFKLREVIHEMEMRWPNRFYVECDPSDNSYRILQRNTVAPYEPSEVYRGQPGK